ncbi:MAG: hypothetical protein LAT50_14940 [Ectothiorhodospiraceae bacterium]|nr:hypothetical protein [Ectothiorhodospiraceae bacterium]
MGRRSFVKGGALSAGCLAMAPQMAETSDMSPRHYPRVRLLNGRGQPLRASEIRPRTHYVFSYPYASTPCFLLNLGQEVPGDRGLETENGESYRWQGGVGPGRSLVAYSAICAHKMAHPTRAVSYIGFREPRNGDDPETGMITCCAENSRYDPYRGGAVLSGPARQPLAAILLEYDAGEDELFAYGTLGGVMFQRFFSEFEARLQLEYPNGDARDPLEGEVNVVRLEEFSANIMRC